MLSTDRAVMKMELSKSSLRNFIILSSFIFLLCVMYHYLTKPHSYEDCVLIYLKSDGSRMAVDFIDDMCEAKFPH